MKRTRPEIRKNNIPVLILQKYISDRRRGNDYTGRIYDLDNPTVRAGIERRHGSRCTGNDLIKLIKPLPLKLLETNDYYKIEV